MLEIFPRHHLRRFVEIPPRLCPRNMDMEYSYAVAPYRIVPDAQVDEDYARRWHAFGAGGWDYPSLRAVENFPARRSPAYEPLGVHAPSVTSSVEREEEEQASDKGEQEPPAPDSSPARTPSTSVGGSPPVAASPRRAPEAQEPPQRRRRLEPVSALFPATPESVSGVQSPSAQANDNLAGADADSSADASHSTPH
ncbi:hypothetical protein Emag_005327 [Eimeria magna]